MVLGGSLPSHPSVTLVGSNGSRLAGAADGKMSGQKIRVGEVLNFTRMKQ